MQRSALFFTLSLCLLVSCDQQGSENANQADTVFQNGKILTVDSTDSIVNSLAVKDGIITALGDVDVESWIGPDTEVIDLEGAMAMPGIIEGHAHFMGIGHAKMILDLTKAESWNDIVNMVEEAAETAEDGQWILGRGWHQEKWSEVPENAVEGVPSHQGMSEVSAANPVLLTHASGHAAFANEMAMQLGRISSETLNPQGGEIVHDALGKPTGLLRETAQGLVKNAYNEYHDALSREEVEAENKEMAKRAFNNLLENGITSFQDAGSDFETIDFLKGLADAGELPVRLYIMVRGENLESMGERLSGYRMIGHADNHLTVRAIKTVIDGAAVGDLAIAQGFQLNTHAIGDRGNREVLDIYERHYSASTEDDLRWRIEHAQHLHPEDIPRFGQLGVIPAMQANHCTSDGPWVAKRIGEERARTGSYVWRSLWDTGAVVTNGTDAPVEDVNPFASIYAGITRKSDNGDIKGSLEIGKVADLVVLDKDLLEVDVEEIKSTKVLKTIVGGKILYSSE